MTAPVKEKRDDNDDARKKWKERGEEGEDS